MAMICRFLEWDSQFFGLRIGRVERNRLSRDEVPSVLQWCSAERIDCLYFLADTNAPETIEAVESYAFQMKDIRVKLFFSFSDREAPRKFSGPGRIRPFLITDLPALRAIASTAYTDSRFYTDGRFMRDKVDLLYQTWIDRSCSGYEDIVLVSEYCDQPVGFITCKVRGGVGEIGLVGVDQQVRKKGFGSRLVIDALSWFADHGALSVEVVTQGRNITAQQLYQRCGFRTQTLHIWYHRWFEY